MNTKKGPLHSKYKHGLSNSRPYNIWCGIKKRCYNKKNLAYPNYGGRGIKVCDMWREDPEAFYLWAISHGYADNLTIDRIDVNGDYCPENCRWTDRHTQNTNQKLRKDNRTGYVGVIKYKWGMFGAEIRIFGKKVHLGSFSTIEEAVIARDKFILANNLTEYKTQILKEKQ